MKKNFVFITSFVLILTMIFSMNVMAAISIRDNPVPLAGEIIFDDDESDETPMASPKTGDNTLLFIILSSMSLAVIGTTVGFMKKSRAQ